MNEPESKPDWEDRLVDLALEESLGGQAPPDLSEKILAASSSSSIASIQPGEQVMNVSSKNNRSGRIFWICLATAASLFVATALILPGFQAERELAEHNAVASVEKKNIKATQETDFDDDKRTIQDESVPFPSNEPAVAYPDEDVWNDSIDRKVDRAQTTGERYARNSELSELAEEFETRPNDAKKTAPSQRTESLQMATTPSIAIAADEESQLGVNRPQAGSISARTKSSSEASGSGANRHLALAQSAPQLEEAAQQPDSSPQDQSNVDFNSLEGLYSQPPVTDSPVPGAADTYGAVALGESRAEGEGQDGRQRGVRQSKKEARIADGVEKEPPVQDSLSYNGAIAGETSGRRIGGQAPGYQADFGLGRKPTEVRGFGGGGGVLGVGGEWRYRERDGDAPARVPATESPVQLESTDPMFATDNQSGQLGGDRESLASGLVTDLVQSGQGQDTSQVTIRGELKLQLGDKIAEYQQLASRQRGRRLDEISSRVSTLSDEIDELRRIKRRYEAQQGLGPGTSGDQYARIYENPFVKTKTTEENFSTFSIDVDTASYANVRQFLMQSGQLPPPDAVRLEELVNYFDYDYTAPTGDVPFASHVEVAGCPWNAEHRLVRIGIKGKEIERSQRPQSNLVFLIDVSGSMNEPAKLPLLVEGMKLLTRELGENDKVAIVVYASSEGLALPSTRGDKQQEILAALQKLRAGGSTAGGAGIALAYKTAVENYIEGGVNRVVLCTDGDFNVGVTSEGALEQMAEENAKETGVFLTVLGFGRGNLNDSMMEKISGKGNGNYHYVDNLTEARKVLVHEMAGTLVTIAKDVKIQIDFNPHQVAGYRLLGYENRMLRTEDFNDDKKDAGEIGAGHTVTALYEIVPAGKSVDVPPVDASKYVKPVEELADEKSSGELLTLRIRYKEPDADVSTKQEFPVTDEGGSFAEATPDFQFASAVASFGMLLRDSEHKGNTSFAAVKEIAQGASERDEHGYRAEFLQLIDRARQLSGE